MWRSLWRSIDRFSLQHFKYVINELQAIKVVDRHNMDLVIDLLQSIVEIVTYGDRQDPRIFECFMEYQVLAEFVRILRISKISRIQAQLLQYLSIMIQNMDSEHAIYYCFSNDYINSIITHQYNFDGGDVAPYYISFLRAVSSKINRDTLCLLVKVHGDVVVSFPLYSEALKFAQHGEKMIQTAVRALTLNIYNVSDNVVYDFITTPPVSKYFTDMIHGMNEQCVHLNSLVHTAEETSTSQRRKNLRLETDKLVDDLYYFKDILCVGDSRLSKMVNQNLLHLLILPILLSLLQFSQSSGSNLSAITSIYVVSRVLQVVGGKYITNSVAGVILYPYMSINVKDAGEGDSYVSFFNDSSAMDKVMRSDSKSEKEGIINGNPPQGHLPRRQLVNSPADDNVCPERNEILSLILSDNPSLLLAALFLLLTPVESKDLEYSPSMAVGPVTMQHGLKRGTSDSQAVGQSILVKFIPQVLNALLKVLASKLPISVHIQWHTGWFLLKLLAFAGNKLDEYNINLFNNSYEQSRERFQKELDGCWFDYVVDTLRDEWARCKTALEEPSQSKDPFFLLELVGRQQIVDGDATSSHVAWQTMVDAVKVFILHLQLKAFICTGELLEKALPDVTSSLPTASGRIHASDLPSASFGSEVSLGSGIPCRIAFSNAGTRDIYLIPVARGIHGKLLLVERHPFRSQRGVVIAIAPLAGLSPKIDEDHPTWLHLRIREFDPSFAAKKGYNSKASNHAADGRWTIGFSNAEACSAARLVILEETSKQRSSVGSILAPLLENNFLGDLSDGQNKGDTPIQGAKLG